MFVLLIISCLASYLSVFLELLLVLLFLLGCMYYMMISTCAPNKLWENILMMMSLWWQTVFHKFPFLMMILIVLLFSLRSYMCCFALVYVLWRKLIELMHDGCAFLIFIPVGTHNAIKDRTHTHVGMLKRFATIGTWCECGRLPTIDRWPPN